MNHSISGPPAAPPLRMTGNQVIIQTLLQLGVDTVFGYIGASVMPLLMLLRPFISGSYIVAVILNAQIFPRLTILVLPNLTVLGPALLLSRFMDLWNSGMS